MIAVVVGIIVRSRAKAKSEHITIQATRTLKRAGTPLRGARALNVMGSLGITAIFGTAKKHFIV